MASRGNVETTQLRANIEGQLTRLVTQLKDLEEMKDEMEPEEYDADRQETLDQLNEFQSSLSKLVAGNMSLVDEIGAIQLKIQSAIAEAGGGASRSSMFEKRSVATLRGRLGVAEAERKAGKMPSAAFKAECLDILRQLEKEDTVLSAHEAELLRQAQTMDGFEKATD